MRWIFALVFALAGCASTERSRLEIEGLNLELGFLVVLDDQGIVTRVIPPFFVEDDMVSDALPTITFVNDEEKFVLVALDKPAIIDAYKGFAEARFEELVVIKDPPPEPDRRIEKNTGEVLVTSLPESAALYTGALEGGVVRLSEAEELRDVIRRSVTFEVPIDAEYCRIENQSPLTAFTDMPIAFLQALPRVANISDLLWLDADRLFAITWTSAAVLRPGRPLLPGPSALELSPDMPNPDTGLRVLYADLDPNTRTSSAARVLVAAHDYGLQFSKLFELEIRGDQIVKILETEHPDMLISDVAILRDGRQLVSALYGVLYERNPNNGELTQILTLPTYSVIDEPQFTHLRAVDDARYPLIAATLGRVHIFDAVESRFKQYDLVQEGIAALDSLDFTMIEATHRGEELEIWLGAERDNLYRKIGKNEWEKIELDYPPRFSPCIARDPMTDEPYFPGRWLDGAISGDYLHLLPRECSALLQVRRDTLCTSVLPRDGAPIAPPQVATTAIDAFEGNLAAGTDYGFVYRSTW